MNLPFFTGWEGRIRKLRKKWDRTREKVLKRKSAEKQQLLEKLDQIENNLRLLEEKDLSRTDRIKVRKEVEIDLEELIDTLNEKQEKDHSSGA